MASALRFRRTAPPVPALPTRPAGCGPDGCGQEPRATRWSDRFGRMFPDLPPFTLADERARAAMLDLGRAGGPMDAGDDLSAGPRRLFTDSATDNPFQPAGTTFFGQFLHHDLTFDTGSPLGVPTNPESVRNARTPALDLDSVYGRGRVADPLLYDPTDPVKLNVESGGRFEDLPRRADHTAIVGDPRDDQNLVVAGLHAAMLLFHNRVVDRLRGQGVPPSTLFDRARQLVTWHYQWIVVNEYLPQLVGLGTTRDVLHRGRRFYRPEPGPVFLPVEFSGAAFRAGHSMVRPSYRANLAGNADGSPFYGFVFDPAGEGQADPVDLRGGRRAPRRFVGWQTFYNFNDGRVRPNKRLDRRISTPLFHLPLGAIPGGAPPVSLPQRNLLRHLTYGLPSGQAVAATMGAAPLTLPELAGYGLERSSPLWYYVLAEAELVSDGVQLGPVGGRIVAEVVIGLLQLDRRAYLGTRPGWRPTLPGRVPGEFGMADLLRFAKVDPGSRGQ